jgi:hypothetical protein
MACQDRLEILVDGLVVMNLDDVIDDAAGHGQCRNDDCDASRQDSTTNGSEHAVVLQDSESRDEAVGKRMHHIGDNDNRQSELEMQALKKSADDGFLLGGRKALDRAIRDKLSHASGNP